MTFFSAFLARSRPAAALILLALAATGCSRARQPKVFIPIQKSAEEQFQYAVRERDRNYLVLRNREHAQKRREARHTVLRSYEVVVENFPQDRKVTPLARLEIADMTAGITSGEERATTGEIREAIAMLTAIRAEYPENEFVQAKTVYDEALCRKLLKDYEKAQTLFKEVAEEYANSKDRDVRNLVQLANYQYQQTYIKK